MEEWRDIPGYESLYQVSTCGRVKSLPREWITGKNMCKRNHSGFIFKNYISKSGYYSCALFKNKKSKTCKIHRLVALTFIPNPENKPEVNHKDGNKLNNHVNNLEWNTRKENMNHAFKNKLYKCRKGINHNGAKLTEEQVIQLRKEYIPYKNSAYKLSKKYGIPRGTIENIVLRRSWKHI